jgi:hypothetical protein
MASETPKYKLPYPEAQDVPDIAGDIQKLALGVDGMLSGMVSGSWGSGPMAGYPAGRDDEYGIPTYVDSNGKLWAMPTATHKHAADPVGSYASNFRKEANPPRQHAWWQWGPFIAFEIFVVRTNSDLAVTSPDGNIAGGFQIGTLASSVPRPISPTSTVNAGAGPLAGIYLMPNGVFMIDNMAPNGRWTKDTLWSQDFFYMTADKVSL